MMIKLTLVDGAVTIVINVYHIVSMFEYEQGTYIKVVSSYDYSVRESISDILNMIEHH